MSGEEIKCEVLHNALIHPAYTETREQAQRRHYQVDTDLLMFLSRAVTVPLYYLNSRHVPTTLHCSSLGFCLKTTRAGGIKQKILLLLPKSSSCCICLGLGKALGGWMREQCATPCKQQRPGFQDFL